MKKPSTRPSSAASRRLLPQYDCDGFQLEYCLGDDRSETLTEAGGVARGAKIAVLDLGGSDGLQPITGGYMWEASSPTEARLHSASWGFPDEPCEVDEASISFDLWAYEVRRRLGSLWVDSNTRARIQCRGCFFLYRGSPGLV